MSLNFVYQNDICNSADPDQTAPVGAVWSGSKLFAIPLSILRFSFTKKAKFKQKKYGIAFEI